jgi:hypothetical protein
MEIISAYLAEKNPNKVNTYVVFFAPDYGGGGIIAGELHMHQWCFEDYKVPTFDSYTEASKHAHIRSFGPDHLDLFFPNDKKTEDG